jgi:hypothetical protein
MQQEIRDLSKIYETITTELDDVRDKLSRKDREREDTDFAQ